MWDCSVAEHFGFGLTSSWSQPWTVTGFAFPLNGITPAMITGVIALVILAVVLIAFYRFHAAQSWRWVYAAGMVASVYLLVFVGVVQAF